MENSFLGYKSQWGDVGFAYRRWRVRSPHAPLPEARSNQPSMGTDWRVIAPRKLGLITRVHNLSRRATRWCKWGMKEHSYSEVGQFSSRAKSQRVVRCWPWGRLWDTLNMLVYFSWLEDPSDKRVVGGSNPSTSTFSFFDFFKNFCYNIYTKLRKEIWKCLMISILMM